MKRTGFSTALETKGSVVSRSQTTLATRESKGSVGESPPIMAITAKDFFQMHTRNAGSGAIYRGRMYIWGGQSSRRSTVEEEFGASSDENDGEGENEEIVIPFDFPKEDDSDSVIDVYDIADKLWWHYPTHGDVPRMGLGPRVCVVDHSLYLYGGWNELNFSSDLYRLDLNTYEWRMVALSNDVKPTPVYLTTLMVYEEVICTFGGVGLIASTKKQEETGAEYHRRSDAPPWPWGWNNEYHEFSIKDSTLLEHCLRLIKRSLGINSVFV